MDLPTHSAPGNTPGSTLPPPPASPGPSSGPRRLRRRPDDSPIAGVCAGVAEYFNVDPVIVRIAAVVLALSGPGVIAYALAWIFVPAADGPSTSRDHRPTDRKDRGTQILGIVLLALALSVIWGDWWSPARRWLFPLGLMGLGAWLLLRVDKRDEPTTSSAVASAGGPLPPASTWAPGAAGPGPTDAPIGTGVATSGAGPATDPDDPAPTLVDGGDGGDGSAGDPPAGPWDVPPPASPEPRAGARHRRLVGPIVFGALLVWSGAAWLAGASVETGLAGGLLILGIGFVLGSFVGGTRILILPALLVAAALAFTVVVDVPLSGPVGQQLWSPQRVADVEDRYEVSVGEGILDLSAIDLDRGDELQVEMTVGVGHLVVLVPEGLAADVTTKVSMGESQVLGEERNGVGIDASELYDDDATGGTLELDLQVGMGQIEVRRVDPDGTSPTSSESPTTSTLG